MSNSTLSAVIENMTSRPSVRLRTRRRQLAARELSTLLFSPPVLAIKTKCIRNLSKARFIKMQFSLKLMSILAPVGPRGKDDLEWVGGKMRSYPLPHIFQTFHLFSYNLLYSTLDHHYQFGISKLVQSCQPYEINFNFSDFIIVLRLAESM